MGWMSHRKWKYTKQEPSMLHGPAVPGCCLISFHFLWAIYPIRPVQYHKSRKMWCSHHGDSQRKAIIAKDEMKRASKRQGSAEVSHFGNTIYPSRSQKMNEPCEVQRRRNNRREWISLSLSLHLPVPSLSLSLLVKESVCILRPAGDWWHRHSHRNGLHSLFRPLACVIITTGLANRIAGLVNVAKISRVPAVSLIRDAQ